MSFPRLRTAAASCSFSGTKTVRYGSDKGYFFKTASHGIACSNDVFADPAVGDVKTCSYGDVAWTPCSGEYSDCDFTGPKVVRYGANGSFVNQFLVDGVPCGNAQFGDPVPGVVKRCDYADPIRTRCSDEWNTCSMSGSRWVRFGWGSSWVYRYMSGPFNCNYGSFGDPAHGVTKVCEYASSF